MLWGESLGTGVAVALAAQKPVGRVLLKSPFTSAAAVASAAYPFVPVRLLMRDQFRSDERIGAVTAPVLVLHGAQDRVVPFAHGERLYGLIRAPKRLVRLAGADHNDHDQHGGLEAVRGFLDGEPLRLILLRCSSNYVRLSAELGIRAASIRLPSPTKQFPRATKPFSLPTTKNGNAVPLSLRPTRKPSGVAL